MKAINAQFDVILSALPGIGAKAADRGREEAAMTLWWIVDLVLLVGGRPRRGDPAAQRPRRGERDRPGASHASRDAARAGSKDLDAVPLLLTTQDQVRQTVENVAAYGGSLDVILDDAR